MPLVISALCGGTNGVAHAQVSTLMLLHMGGTGGEQIGSNTGKEHKVFERLFSTSSLLFARKQYRYMSDEYRQEI
jgi:hypothetical protein